MKRRGKRKKEERGDRKEEGKEEETCLSWARHFAELFL